VYAPEQLGEKKETPGSRRTIQFEFELLKHRMLLRVLDETPNPEAHALIIHEADHAAALACTTPYPQLVFPCLFEERAGAAAERARWGARLYWRGLAMQCEAGQAI
jgi:hypothetical protein